MYQNSITAEYPSVVEMLIVQLLPISMVCLSWWVDWEAQPVWTGLESIFHRITLIQGMSRLQWHLMEGTSSGWHKLCIIWRFHDRTTCTQGTPLITANEHFFLLHRNPLSCSCCSNACKFCKCFSALEPLMRLSSRYMTSPLRSQVSFLFRGSSLVLTWSHTVNAPGRGVFCWCPMLIFLDSQVLIWPVGVHQPYQSLKSSNLHITCSLDLGETLGVKEFYSYEVTETEYSPHTHTRNFAFCWRGSSVLRTGTTGVPYSQNCVGSRAPCSVPASIAWLSISWMAYGTVQGLQKNGFASGLKAIFNSKPFRHLNPGWYSLWNSLYNSLQTFL